MIDDELVKTPGFPWGSQVFCAGLRCSWRTRPTQAEILA